jgi:hypothetical protein
MIDWLACLPQFSSSTFKKVLGQADPYRSVCIEPQIQWADVFFLLWWVGYFFINIDILHNKKGKEKTERTKP